MKRLIPILFLLMPLSAQGKYFAYYNTVCMGKATQWNFSQSHYMPVDSFFNNIGNITHVITFGPDDNVDTAYSPYFTFSQEYVDAGGSENDSVNFWFNGINNPGSGAGAGADQWTGRGDMAKLRDSLQSRGKYLIVEIQDVVGTETSWIFADSTRTDVFAKAIADWVTRNGIDGVDYNAETSVTWDSTEVARYFRLLRGYLPNAILTAVPVVTHMDKYYESISSLDYIMPQHYAYATNWQTDDAANGVFLNSPLYTTNAPAGNHQTLKSWGPTDWFDSGWPKAKVVVLLSTEANPWDTIDTTFSVAPHGKTFWADTVARYMETRGGTYTWDSIHLGGYISGTADTTISATGGGANRTIDSGAVFYICVLAKEALDSVTTWAKSQGFENFGLYDTATDARPNASDGNLMPLHKYLSNIMRSRSFLRYR